MEELVLEYPKWALVLCPIIGLAFALLLYFRERRLSDIPQSLRTLLGVLRFAVITVLCFLLLGPLVRYIEQEIEAPLVVLGIDNSNSMVMGKDSAQTAEGVNKLISQLNTGLGEDYDLAIYTFGQGVDQQAEPTFSEPVTDISSFLESVKGRYTNRNLGAVVLASDGIYNRGTNPRYALSGINAPVYTLAMGDTTQRKDALIAEVAANRIAFLGNKFPVEALIRAEKLEGENLNYSVSVGGKVLQSESIQFEGSRFEKTVRFLIDAAKVGLQRYTISITNFEGEVTLSNNQRSVYVDVIDSRQKVLILGHAPHPDIAALRRAVSANENYEVKVAFEDQFTENPDDFDLAILHQVPSANTDQNLMTALSDTPLLGIVGGQTDFNQFKALGLGASYRSTKTNTNDVGAALNQNFKLFQTTDGLDAFLSDAPPLRTPFGDWQMANSGEIVLNQQVGNIATDNPLLVVNQRSDRKSAALLGEGIWRWRLYDYARNDNHKTFDAFIGSLVQYLAVKEDKRSFRVQAPSDVMENEPVIMSAELYNASYEAVNDEEVTITLRDEDGQGFPFTFSRTENAYRLDAGQLPVGNYTYTASVSRNGERLTDSGSLSIRPFALEGATLTANHNVLSALSQNSGGTMAYPQNITELVNRISGSNTMQPVSYSTEVLSSILNFKWLFFTILGLLSIEWFVRKRAGHY